MPKAHQEHKEWTMHAIMDRAATIGPKTVSLLEAIIASHDFPAQGMRPCLGIIRLEKTYGKERLEKASIKALAVGMTRYADIAAMLKNNLEDSSDGTAPKPTSKPLPTHDNIRGSAHYQSRIADRTMVDQATHAQTTHAQEART